MSLFTFDGCEISVDPPLYKKLKSGRRTVFLSPKYGGVLEGIKVVYRNGRVEKAAIPVTLMRRDSPGSTPVILDKADRDALPSFIEDKLRAMEREAKITPERRGL